MGAEKSEAGAAGVVWSTTPLDSRYFNQKIR